MGDPYLYQDSLVLRNKLDIHDQKLLDDAEADFVVYRLKQLALNPLSGDYHTGHLLRMHEYIFRDLFEWAGMPRTISICKEEDVLGGQSIEYSAPGDIMSDLHLVLLGMQEKDWANMPRLRKAYEFCDSLARLWKIHPFRDAHVIIGTRLEKPSKINGFALLSPIFLSHAGWREDGAVHINTYYTESQMGLCA